MPPRSSRSSSVSRHNKKTRTDTTVSVQPPELPKALRSKRSSSARSRRGSSSQYPQDQGNQRASSTRVVEAVITASYQPLDSILEESIPETDFTPNPPLTVTSLSSPDVPTPGIPSFSVDSFAHFGFPLHHEPENVEVHHDPFQLASPAEQYSFHRPATAPAKSSQQAQAEDMSSLGFIVPSHYGSLDPFAASSLDSTHYGHGTSQASPTQQYSQATSPASVYPNASFPPSPAVLPSTSGTRRQSLAQSAIRPYGAPIPQSAYQNQQKYESATSPAVAYNASSAEAAPVMPALTQSASYPSVQASMPGQTLATLSYSPELASNQPQYSGANYGGYGYPPMSSSPQMYGATTSASYPPPYMPGGMARSSSMADVNAAQQPGGQNVRVINSRPKPQCWEHGCNGRQFSTFSNLLRHQREKSGTASKSYCPRCGAEFTRTTARNGHMAHDKCKTRRQSGSESGA